MSQTLTRAQAKTIIEWQMDVGVSETVAERPVSRFDIVSRKPRPAKPERRKATEGQRPAPQQLAAECGDLEALHRAIQDYHGCALRRTARNTVIADGNPAARVMVVGEAPGAEEDETGRPFVGRSGRLMDEALALVGLARDAALPEDSVYISNIVFWRPPGNRNPTPEEVDLLLPFTLRHIALARPEVLLALGNVACQSLLKASNGITKLRGEWREVQPGRQDPPVPTMPSFHPSFLLRTPRMKKFFWKDLLTLRQRLDGGAGKEGAQ